jgi:hypothetical protein
MIPFRGDQTEWPRDQLRDKALAWHYDESISHTYSGWQTCAAIIEDHFKELIGVARCDLRASAERHSELRGA